ncbi:regulatory LuxR family protein [Humibacillus xanthopallidus]|uniref:Regulatory LuxR family protein n=2 Tax=Humibacillus xanthopallidus TaxID=412689 RepID=A0A543I276_9MICO|nr:regulatory LuxR family protein [Humibacillus xanthopallidus]
MIGRDAELDRLCAIAADVREGVGGGALVTGEAGIGKSRLITEFATVERSQGLLVLVGHGVDLAGGHLPFGTLADTVRDAVHRLGRDELERLAPDACRALGAIVPVLAGAPARESSAGASPSADRVAVLGGAIQLIDALTAERPLCWVVDDLQWADPQTLDLIAVVTRGLESRRVMFVGTFRTPVVEPEAAALLADLASLSEVITIRLGRLDEATARRQLRRVRGAALDPATEERILRLGEGLPLFIEHLAIEAGTTPNGVPESLGAIVDGRLRRLADAVTAVVDAAAVAEGPTDLEGLATVTGSPPAVVGAAVDEAAAARVLEQGDDGELRFVHTLVRDWVVSRLPPARRRALHRAWADLLDGKRSEHVGDVVASALHRRAAGDEAGAIRGFGRAAVIAARTGDSTLETSCLRQVYALWGSVQDAEAVCGMGIADVLFNLCVAGTSADEVAVLGDVLRRELAGGHLAGTATERLWLTMRLEQAEGRAPAAPVSVEQTTRDRARVLFEAAPSLVVLDALQIAGRWARRFDGALAARLHRRAWEMAREVGDTRARIRSEVFVGFDHLARVEPLAEARRLLALEAEYAALPVADWSMAVESAVTCLVDAGHYDEASVLAEQALLRLQDPQLAPRRYAGIAVCLGAARAEVGDWSGAERWLQVVESTYEPVRSEVAGIRLRIMTRRGQVAQLEPHLSTAMTALEPGPDLVGQRHELADVVTALYAVGKASEARRWLHALEGEPGGWWFAALWPALNAALRFEVAALQAPAPGGDPELIARLDELSQQFDWRGPAADAFRAEHVALLARSRRADSVDQWAAAADGWAGIDRAWDEAVCRLRLAEAYAAQGDRRLAASELLRANDIAGRLGAAGLLAEARVLGRRHGVALPIQRLTPPSSDLVSPLTAREREVLELVAEGRTNDEIAGRLCISPKTASVHVSRILAKLRAGNRTEAVAIGRREGLVG